MSWLACKTSPTKRLCKEAVLPNLHHVSPFYAWKGTTTEVVSRPHIAGHSQWNLNCLQLIKTLPWYLFRTFVFWKRDLSFVRDAYRDLIRLLGVARTSLCTSCYIGLSWCEDGTWKSGKHKIQTISFAEPLNQPGLRSIIPAAPGRWPYFHRRMFNASVGAGGHVTWAAYIGCRVLVQFKDKEASKAENCLTDRVLPSGWYPLTIFTSYRNGWSQ